MILAQWYQARMTDHDEPTDELSREDTRDRIVAAAAKLIGEGGGEAATTRAVAAAAAVQAPTIYRLFGDKRGLLEAVAEDAFAAHVAGKMRREADPDPVADLRLGWDSHVEFGLANPAVFALISATYAGPMSRAALAGLAVLRERVRKVARAGRLRVSEERAVDLLHAMGVGTILTLLPKSPEERAGLSEAARETVLAAILDEAPMGAGEGPAGAASALRAQLDEVPRLTPGERMLLDELLRRIAG